MTVERWKTWHVSGLKTETALVIPSQELVAVVLASDYDELVGKLKGMHRRAQTAESAAMLTVEACRRSSPHTNLRRALYAVAAKTAEERAEKAEAALARAGDRCHFDFGYRYDRRGMGCAGDRGDVVRIVHNDAGHKFVDPR